MHKSLLSVSVSLVFAYALPAHAAGKVEVSYVEPEKFTDVGFGSVERERTLRDMSAVLEALGDKLPDGQTLKLTVTNINLAGEWRPHRGQDLRVMNGRTDWPEVNLRYTLQAGDATLKSGEAKIYDMAYQLNAGFVNRIGTNLPYERHMLRKWFTETIAPAP
jgi:hypothetical protein